MAGTPGNKNTADYVYNQWRSQKLDKVQMTDYDVLLDYPNPDKPNTIDIFTSSVKLETSYSIYETDYDKYSTNSTAARQFLACRNINLFNLR